MKTMNAEELSIRYVQDGLLIPSECFQGIGTDVHAQRNGDVIIIEPIRRHKARRRLKEKIEHLRIAAEELSPISDDEIAALVKETRGEYACHH